MSDIQPNDAEGTSRMTVGFCLLLVIVAFFLWTEHRAHLYGILPYVILLACPLIHLFMHRRHDTHGHGSRGRSVRHHGRGDDAGHTATADTARREDEARWNGEAS